MDDQAYLERVYGDVGGVSVKLFLGVLLVVTLAYGTITDLISISERSRTPHTSVLSTPKPVKDRVLMEEREEREGMCGAPQKTRMR